MQHLAKCRFSGVETLRHEIQKDAVVGELFCQLEYVTQIPTQPSRVIYQHAVELQRAFSRFLQEPVKTLARQAFPRISPGR